MTQPLNVLVLEHRRGAARDACAELEAAGHHVHRCHGPDDRGFPCRGVVNPAACPLTEPIDVALVVRHRVDPRPSSLEDGVPCAIRAGVPIVEDGPEVLDPFSPWVVQRVSRDLDVVDACQLAADQGFDPLRVAITERTAGLLAAHGIDPASLTCRFAMSGRALHVLVDVEGRVDSGLEQALAVRVLDALRCGRRTYDQVNVQVTGTL